jgi:hypothetical protein
LTALRGVLVRRKLEDVETLTFSLAFVTKQKELDALSRAVAKKVKGDAVVWIAYPKRSSKNYTCAFNRDAGWDVLGKAGLEAVRQVAIDEDWSALRFRRLEFIKSMTRQAKRAITAKGKSKAAKR